MWVCLLFAIWRLRYFKFQSYKKQQQQQNKYNKNYKKLCFDRIL